MKYVWIKQHSLDYSVTVLCQFMTVSRSCYYEWLDSPKTEREKENENEELIEILKVLFEKGRGTYGARRLKNKLAEQGIVASRRRIGRLMKQAGLWCSHFKCSLSPQQKSSGISGNATGRGHDGISSGLFTRTESRWTGLESCQGRCGQADYTEQG